MNNVILFGLIFSITFFCIYNVILVIRFIRRNNKNKKLYPAGIRYKPEDLCKNLHSWVSEILVMIRPLPMKQYMVCRSCGLIQGTDYKFNDAGINSLNLGIEKKEIQEKENTKLQARIKDDLNAAQDEWIKGNLEDIITASKNDNKEIIVKTLKVLFWHALAVEEEISEKIISEIKYQKELDVKYETDEVAKS